MYKALQTLLILLVPIVTLGQRLDYDTTFNSNGQNFNIKRFQLDKYMTLLKVMKGREVILSDTSDFSIELELLDFNGDGGLDIMINFMGNVDIQSLFMLNKEKNVFEKIKNFNNYQAAKKINESNYYYSYHRSGCADNYWKSDLFTIVEFKIVHLGQISGQGCEEPMNIKIYKIRPGKEDLKETLPYKLVTNHKNDKWGFIEDYWTKNFQLYK